MSRPLARILVVALAACDSNQSGNLESSRLGDTSHTLASGSPIDEVRAACGDGGMTAAGSMVHRQPYLQQVTDASAMVGWVSMQPADESVVLSTPGGQQMESATAAVEDGTHRSAGENQMWATLGNLQPDTIECYTLDAGPNTLATRTGFRTAPDPSSTKTIRFLAFGDSGGGGTDQLTLRDQMFNFPFDLMIHTGDIAYDDGSIDQLEDNVFGVYHELLKNVPLFPAPGNHDAKTLQGAPFRDVFALPGDSNEHWYSYDWGRIHFAALDTEADYATQAAWLEADLAASNAPWKIVYMHRPMFSSGNHGSDMALRGLIAPIVERHHVQLVLAGHDHDYERSVPQNGVEYVVTGGGGRGTYDVGASSFTAFSVSVIHFVIVEVGVDELTLHAIDASGVEFDSIVVPRVASQ